MASPVRPVFLAASSYRQKRIRDAARLLPAVGVILLLLVPLLWTRSGEPAGVSNSGALLYVFGVWAALILAAAFLSRVLRPDEEEASEGEAGDP